MVSRVIGGNPEESEQNQLEVVGEDECEEDYSQNLNRQYSSNMEGYDQNQVINYYSDDDEYLDEECQIEEDKDEDIDIKDKILEDNDQKCHLAVVQNNVEGSKCASKIRIVIPKQFCESAITKLAKLKK